MTKATKYFIAAAVALLTLAGCDDNEPDANGGKESPDFTATIGSVQSRAYDNNWEAGDQIGISTTDLSNIRHITEAGDGRFKVGDSKDQIYFKDDNEVTFTAYYPWKELNGASTIEADTKAQDKQKDFDFLWAEASGSKNNPDVNFTFSHKMAKVVLTVRQGDNMNDNEFEKTSLSFGGIIHAGSFNIDTGSASTTGSADEGWEFAKSITGADNGEVTYTFIFFPQNFEKPLAFVAKFPDGGSTHQLTGEIYFSGANNGDNALIAGRQYNLSVTLQKTGLTFGGCTINDWDEATVGDINME